MKRVRDIPSVIEEEKFDMNTPGYSDIWSYIFNIYYHLKIDGQWRQFKENANYCCFFPPVDNIYVPIFTGWDTKKMLLNICLKINRLYWNAYGLYGIEADTHRFQADKPELHLPTKKPILLVDCSFKHKPDIMALRNVHVTGISIGLCFVSTGRFQVKTESFPEHVRQILSGKIKVSF